MYRGPIDHICLECGANNSITSYIEFYDCYACGKRKHFQEGIKKYLKEKFPEGAVTSVVKDTDKAYEKGIFNSLNLSEVDRKYIYMRQDTVYFSFPLKMDMKLQVGDKELKMNIKEGDSIHKKVCGFFGDELYDGGFKAGGLPLSEGICELWFYREIKTDDEAKDVIRRLSGFKKRFGF